MNRVTFFWDYLSLPVLQLSFRLPSRLQGLIPGSVPVVLRPLRRFPSPYLQLQLPAYWPLLALALWFPHFSLRSPRLLVSQVMFVGKNELFQIVRISHTDGNFYRIKLFGDFLLEIYTYKRPSVWTEERFKPNDIYNCIEIGNLYKGNVSIEE